MRPINQRNSNLNKEGYWEEYFPNGKIMYKGNWKNGKRNGYWEIYYSDGKLSYTAFYATN